MKYFIEEAVIVETYETEPKLSIETVQPEIIGQPRRKRRRRSRGLFSSIFDDIFDLFFDDFEDNIEDYSSENPVKDPIIPETALIVETNESKITEIKYLYAEIIK